MKIVKNEGQIETLRGKSRYLLRIYDKGNDVTMYAKPGLKPVVGAILAKFKFD